MSPSVRSLAAILVTAVAAASLSVPGGPDAALTAQTREMRERAVWVSVIDQKGKPVGDLGPDEFVIREDGRRREAIRVQKATEPIDLTLMIDTSAAMERHMQSARLALKELVTALNPHASIALVTFGERPTIQVDRTNTLAAIARGVDRLFSIDTAGAYMLEAVLEVASGLRKRQPARPVIAVVVTDGIEFTDQSADFVLVRLAETGARFDVFNVNEGSAGEMPDQPARERARLIAEGTSRSGGTRAELLTDMALQKVLADYATELLNQTRVVYVRPDSLIPPVRIEVSVTRPGLTVRSTPVPQPRG